MFRLIRSTTRVFPRSFLALEALALLAFVLFPGRVAAQTITGCSSTPIMTSSTIPNSITAASTDPDPCISIGADNVTITFNPGVTVNISAFGDNGVAIDAASTSGTIISGPGSNVGGPANIVTAYSGPATAAGTAAAIRSSTTSNITISGLTIWNVTSTCTPGLISNGATTNQANQNWGTAISIANASGATISANVFECYQTGISVSASAIPSKDVGEIAGNGFYNIMFDNSFSASSTVISAAILLDSSSGWSIDGNTVNYSGSRDASYYCNTSDYGNCSPAIQLTGTSNGNLVNGNFAADNFGPTIYTGPNTAKNKILSNNITPGGSPDLWDAVPPRSTNAWRQNTCPDGALGSVGPQKCP